MTQASKPTKKRQKKRRSVKKRRWPLILTSVLLGLFLIIGLVIFVQTKLFISPFRNTHLGQPRHLSYEEVTFHTRDKVPISAWYVPGTRPSGIVLVHGVYANRSEHIGHAQILSQAGYHLLLLDLRAHGLSGGDKVTYGYYEVFDVMASVDYLLKQQPKLRHIGALGNSMGGAVVVRAAAYDERIQAIVIQSSFSSLVEAVHDSFDQLALLPKQPFAPWVIASAEWLTGAKMSHINSMMYLSRMSARPVFILHRSHDNLFPPAHAKRMYAHAQEPKELWIVEGAGHTSPMVGNEAQYRQKILQFFEKAFRDSQN